MKYTGLMLIMLLFFVGCNTNTDSSQLSTSSFCDEQAKKIGIEGEFWCEVDDKGVYYLFTEKTDKNIELWNEYDG